MNMSNEASSSARQKFFLSVLASATILVGIVIIVIIVSLIFGKHYMLPISLLLLMIIVSLLDPDYRHRLLASVHIVVNSILDVAKYALFFWPMIISVIYFLFKDISGGIAHESVVRSSVVLASLPIALAASIVLVRNHSKYFNDLMKAMSLEMWLVFAILVVLYILLSVVFGYGLSSDGYDFFESISLLGSIVLNIFLLLLLLVSASPKIIPR